MDIRRFMRDYKKLLHVKVFIRDVLANRGTGIIAGTPGGGKTYTTLAAIRDLLASRELKKVVVLEPQRYLRDYVASKLLPASFVVKPRDELCPVIANVAKNSDNDNYLIVAFKECVKCEHYRKETCPFYAQFKKLIRMREGVVVTTHNLGPIVTWLFKPQLVVFDEAEDYLQVLSKPIHPQVLDELKNLDEKEWKRIRANLIERLGKYYLKPTWFDVVGSKALLISATFPPKLQQFIGEAYGKPDDLLYIPVYTIESPNKDWLLVLDAKQVFKKSGKLEDQKWWRELIPRLIDMVNTAIEKVGVAGIVSKNKTMTVKLHDLFTNLGYEVTSDAVDEYPEQNAQIWIITARGKWYRGVSFRPKQLKGRKDFPVIFSFYQAQEPKKWVAKVPPWMWEWEIDHSVVWEIVKDLIRAENVQTLFRFNRDREKRHLIVLFDRRMLYALEKLLPSYTRTIKHKEIVKTPDELVKRYIELLEKL